MTDLNNASKRKVYNRKYWSEYKTKPETIARIKQYRIDNREMIRRNDKIYRSTPERREHYRLLNQTYRDKRSLVIKNKNTVWNFIISMFTGGWRL